MANVSNFSAVTPVASVSGTLTDKQVVAPAAPTGIRADGPRVTFHFIKEPWDSGNTYVYYDVVKDNSGASWICKYPQVPAGTPLEEGTFWTRWADPNLEVEELYANVQEYLSEVNGIKLRYCRCYENVAAMLADTSLTVGCVCHTNGFYSVNDKGAAFYVVTENTTDGYSNLKLANGKTATITALEKAINLKQLGAKIDGLSDDLAVIKHAINTYPSLFLTYTGTALISNSLEITAETKLNIDTLKCAFDAPAVIIHAGVYGNVYISSIRNTVGGGVVIDSNNDTYSLFEFNNIRIDYMRTNKTCLDFKNTDGVLDSTFSGISWESENGNVFDVENAAEYVGQLKMRVNRFTAPNGIAINIVSNAPITGIDFGYSSVEGSKISLNINAKTKSIEPISGYFRCIENTRSGKTVFKISGNLGLFDGIHILEADELWESSIDISGITTKTPYYKDFCSVHIKARYVQQNTEQQSRYQEIVIGPGVLYKNRQFKPYQEFAAQTENNIPIPGVLNVYNIKDYTIPDTWDGSPLFMQLQNETTLHYLDASVTTAFGEGTYIVVLDWDAVAYHIHAIKI